MELWSLQIEPIWLWLKYGCFLLQTGKQCNKKLSQLIWGAHSQWQETIWHVSSDQPADGNLVSWTVCKEQQNTREGELGNIARRRKEEMAGEEEKELSWGEIGRTRRETKRRWQVGCWTAIILTPFSPCTGVRWAFLQTVLSGQWPNLRAAWLICPVKGPLVQLCQSRFHPTSPIQLPLRGNHINQQVKTPAESKRGWQHFPGQSMYALGFRHSYNNIKQSVEMTYSRIIRVTRGSVCVIWCLPVLFTQICWWEKYK